MPLPNSPRSASSGPSPVEKEELFTEVIGTRFVRLFVGKKRKEFSAHRNLVCQASSILKIKFEKAKPSVSIASFDVVDELNMPDDDPLAVQDFITFIYRDAKTVASYSRTVTEHINLYVFAEKYEVHVLKDVAMDGIQDQLRKNGARLTLENMKDIFSRTHPSADYINHLRRLCAAYMHHYLDSPNFFTAVLVHNWLLRVPELLQEFLDHERSVLNARGIVGLDPGKRGFGDLRFDVCYFHSHGEGEPCMMTGSNVSD